MIVLFILCFLGCLMILIIGLKLLKITKENDATLKEIERLIKKHKELNKQT